MDKSNWDRYDIDWPEFNQAKRSYLNIGAPPVVDHNHRGRYMTFWNQNLPDELNRTLYANAKPPSAELYPTSTQKSSIFDRIGGGESTQTPQVQYYLEKSTENPIRQLQFLLHHTNPNRTDMYQTQSTATVVNAPSIDVDLAAPSAENTFVLGDNHQRGIVVKADSTLNVLIIMIIIFLLINVVIIFAYYLRRNYFKRNLKRKLDVLSLDGTTDDDLKRSNKFNDGDESFILDIVRRKNEYVPVNRTHSPINGFLLSRHYSTSTMDTHTKVSDWISHEVNCHSPKMRAKSPSFSAGDGKSFYAIQNEHKINVGINAKPTSRTESILRQHPNELMKSKSFDTRDTIICQEVDVRSELLDSIDLRNCNERKSTDFILHIDHRPSRSDPVAMTQSNKQKPFSPDEEITSFIEDNDFDVNVTSRDECDGATHFQLTPEETLQVFQMRNYPKVLPRYPNTTDINANTNLSSFKRRSMPSYQHLLHQYGRAPPAPPPRTISTLDRKSSMKRSQSDNSGERGRLPPIEALAKRANEPPSPPIEEEPPELTNALHVGPLLPGSKENLYSTMKKRTQPMSVTFQLDDTDDEIDKSQTNEQNDVIEIEQKNNNENTNENLAHSDETKNCFNSNENKNTIQNQANRSESISSVDTSSSSAETVRQIY